ncbi:AbrB family transcriptional regulator [Halobacillus sp. MO56]
MNEFRFIKISISFLIAAIGGAAFHLLQLPLPWILGPVTFLLLYKITTKQPTDASLKMRNISFGFLGIQIGSTFTANTFINVTPYLFPYTIFTLLLIAISLLNAYFLSKVIKIDAKTSMLGSVPGGLSAMLALSESLKGNTVLVTIIQTIRLVTILFVIPFAATQFFAREAGQGVPVSTSTPPGEWYTLGIYIAAFVLGSLLQKRVPASLVIIPMLITGVSRAFGLPLLELPTMLFILAQLSLGVYLGNSVSITDLVKAGRYCLYYFVLALLLIGMSFGFGFLLSQWTSMSLPTAILSIAPGGLIEMALTADEAGGDPSIVSSLQMIRLLMIVLILPFVLQWLIPKLEKLQAERS